MKTKHVTVEEIQNTIAQLRKDPSTRRRFPRELWDEIIALTKTYSVQDLCQQLHLNPIYLKRKMDQFKEQVLEFREISLEAPLITTDVVTIEINSSTGLTAKIQGPLACLNYLCKLFERQ